MHTHNLETIKTLNLFVKKITGKKKKKDRRRLTRQIESEVKRLKKKMADKTRYADPRKFKGPTG